MMKLIVVSMLWLALRLVSASEDYEPMDCRENEQEIVLHVHVDEHAEKLGWLLFCDDTAIWSKPVGYYSSRRRWDVDLWKMSGC